jgi:hypothetical protein
MTACSPIIITDVGPAEWDRLRLAAVQHLGLTAGVTGTYAGNGFTVSWVYHPDAAALTVMPHDVPVGCGLFESLLRHGIATSVMP